MSTARTLTSTTVQVGEHPDDFEQIDVIVTEVGKLESINGLTVAACEGVDPQGFVVKFDAWGDAAWAVSAHLDSFDVVHANVEAWQITESV